jgi:hypothetical protein
MMRSDLLGRCLKLQLIVLSVCFLHLIRGAESPTSVCDREPSTLVVFVGTLTDAKEGDGNVFSLKFHITEPLLGKTSSEVSTDTVNMPDCSIQKITAHIGENYLVQAHAFNESYVDTSWGCQHIRPARETHAEIEYFRRLQKGQTPTEILGEARFQKWLPLTGFPLPATKIRLVGGGHDYNYVSDDRGLFRGVLNPGQYKVSVDFPKGFEPNTEGPFGPLHGLCGPLEFTMAEGRCTSVTVCAQASGSITVHIVDADGDSLASRDNVELTLTTAERAEFIRNVFPDEKSNLVFENLLPGKYILGLTHPALEGAPYRPVYFPGVSSRTDAQVISLEAGEHKILPEMRIKKGIPCKIPVRVIDEDHKPLPSGVVTLAYPETGQFDAYPDWQPDANGKAAVYAVFPGIVYLRAEKENEARTGLDADVVEVTSCPAEPVFLKVGGPVTHAQEPHRN